MTQAISATSDALAHAESATTFRKVTARLIPFLFLCYVLNYIDRLNVGFAQLHMRSDLGFSDTVYGMGVGLFFIGYLVFEVPSNLLLEKIGARKTLLRIMVLWGLASTATMFVSTPVQFYVIRFLVGAAEAGFLPGILLYLTYWYPAAHRGRITAMFISALPIAGIIGSPISGWIMNNMSGVRGLHAWQWLFLLEGIPSVVVGVIAYFYLQDGPDKANWLSEQEKALIKRDVEADRRLRESKKQKNFLSALRDPKLYVMALLGFATYWSANAIAFWAPTIIRGTGVSSIAQVGLLTALPSLGGLVSMILVGRHSDRTLERRWHAAGAALVSATALAVLPLFFGSTAGAVALLTLCGVGHFAFVAVFWTIPPSYLAGSAAAGGIAAIGAMSAMGGAIVPALLGWIKTTTGSLGLGMYAISAVLVIAVTVMLLAIPASALKGQRST
ncbi:MAG: MFS transporter [Burkholderiales bacterium]|nr:MFS transporter [Burkholderiales bacterium]MDE1925820.1 MFS transporter [Burkholderiales bacterium]